MLSSLGLNDLLLDGWQVILLQQLEGLRGRKTLILIVVLLNSSIEEKLSFLAIVDQMLHIALITILPNNGLIPQLLLQLLDLLLTLLLNDPEPSLSNQCILLVFMLIP